MGIEKISGGSAMSYQGSAAMAAPTTSVEPVSASAEQQAVQTMQTVTQPAQSQGYSSQKRGGEDSEQQKELTEAQQNQLKNAVNDFNKQMKDSEAIFGIHDKTNRVTIKIVDKKTKEVIKEYPPEQTLDMIAKVWEIAGILVDEKR